jgi:protein OS-9
VGGSKCEDVGDAYRETERQSEVRFVCAEDGAEGVSSVEEPATCKYVLTFRTPLVCEVEDLRPKRPDVERIECSRVDDDDDEDDDATTTRDDADVTPVEDATARASRDEL